MQPRLLRNAANYQNYALAELGPGRTMTKMSPLTITTRLTSVQEPVFPFLKLTTYGATE